MRYYPICLDIQNRKCLVVGGGRVAERKARGLLESGAAVTVISPKLTERLQEQASQGAVRWLPRGYEKNDVEGYFLVITATDSEETQVQVFSDAESRGIPINVADVPHRCSFILPAQVKRGDLSIAISTAGKSPALAKKIRRRLEGVYGNEYRLLVEILGKIRPHVLSQGKSQKENEAVFNGLLETELLDCIQEENWQKVQELLQRHCGCSLSERDWQDVMGEDLIRTDGCKRF